MNFTEILNLVPRADIFYRTAHIYKKYCVKVFFPCPATWSLVQFQRNNPFSLLAEITGYSNQKNSKALHVLI